MKQRTKVVLAAAGLLTLLIVAGCEMPVSIEGRINRFLSDMNSADRSNAYLNFHPTLVSDYGVIKSADWDGLFAETDRPFSLADLNDSDPSYVTAVIEDGGANPVDFAFEMALDGASWMIVKLDKGANGSWQVQ